MKTSNKLSIKRQEEISKRLYSLRKEKNLTQKSVASFLDITEKTYREWEIGKYDKNNLFYYPSIEYNNLFALSDLYNVSIDYLLCRSNFRSPENEFIGEYTGLSDDAIDGINIIYSESENWKKSVTQKNTMGYDDMHILNFFLKHSSLLSKILRGFQDLINMKYKIPVYFNQKENNFIVPSSNYDITQSFNIGNNSFQEMRWLNLAQSEKNPSENISIALTNDFFESIALKSIEKTFLELRELYIDNNSDAERK